MQEAQQLPAAAATANNANGKKKRRVNTLTTPPLQQIQFFFSSTWKQPVDDAITIGSSPCPICASTVKAH